MGKVLFIRNRNFVQLNIFAHYKFASCFSCEVIRDRKTGDSLQYAFVEFEDAKSCEAAYFKVEKDAFAVDFARLGTV
jgi:RNA recognition motif-containing protein